MFEYRFKGSLPKIGIRPTIDGRLGGGRESQERQTLAQARSVARLLKEKLRHPSGHRVECVIPERCISGLAESAAVAERFARQGVGVSLTVTPCWCYGAETIDMDPMTSKATWGYNSPDRPGAVYLAAALAAQNQQGLPAFGIYGRDPERLRRKRPGGSALLAGIGAGQFTSIDEVVASAILPGAEYTPSDLWKDECSHLSGLHQELYSMTETLHHRLANLRDNVPEEACL